MCKNDGYVSGECCSSSCSRTSGLIDHLYRNLCEMFNGLRPYVLHALSLSSLSLLFRSTGFFRSEHCVFVLTEFITDNNVCSSLLRLNIVVHIKASGISQRNLCFTFISFCHFVLTSMARIICKWKSLVFCLFVCVRLRSNQFFSKRCSSLNEYLRGFCHVWIDTIFALLYFHSECGFLAEDSDGPVR